MAIEGVKLVYEVLAEPEGPTNKELQKQARRYIAALKPSEHASLRREAQSEGPDVRESDYASRAELLARMRMFTPTEIQAYSHMRLNCPAVRRVLARRALLIKKLGGALPKDITFVEVARIEDVYLGGLTDEQVFAQLGVNRGRGGDNKMDALIIREAAKAEDRRRLWASKRGKATRQFLRDHPEAIEEYEETGAFDDVKYSVPDFATKASITLELVQRGRRKEMTRAVREWRENHPEEAERIKEEALHDSGTSYTS